jgi:hypothetical protein
MKRGNQSINFLLYDNRSGSTYLSALLDNFSEIGVTIESPIMYYLLTGKNSYRTESQVNQAIRYIYRDQLFIDWAIPQKFLVDRLIHNLPLTKGDFIYLVLQAYFHLNKPAAKCWVYKAGNPYVLHSLKRIFADAKSIYIYRDGRAVFSSKKRAKIPLDNRPMEQDPIRAAKLWVKYNKFIKTSRYASDVLLVKYENLITNTDDELIRIYDFLLNTYLNLKVNYSNTETYQSKIPVSQIHMHTNVNEKPLRSRINAWKEEISNSERHLYEKFAYKGLKEMGYEVEDPARQIPNDVKREEAFLRLKIVMYRLIRYWRRLKYYYSAPKALFWNMLFRLDKH